LLKTANLDSLPSTQVEMPKNVPSADNWDVQLERARSLENSGDILQAVEAYKALAGQGFAKAQFRLGYVYFDSVLKDMHLAVYWWKRAAEQGHAAAQYNLGLMCERGLGMPVDMREAMQWFEKAANAGDEKARAKLLAGMRNSPVTMPAVNAQKKEVPEEPTAFIGKPRSASETEQAGKAFFTRKK
jgi:TPR repeat protein